MGIGKFKQRITFQKPVINVDGNGYETEKLENYKMVWAKVMNLSGREYFEAAAIKQERIIKFIVRAITGIDETMKILFQDKVYDIVFINNIGYQNKYMEIKAMEVN